MTALMPTTTTATLADMHREPSTERLRLWQLLLVLELRALMLDLSTALTPRRQRRHELLINLPGRLAMPVPAVLIPRPASRPAPLGLRLPARERRRKTLPSPTRLLKLTLELRDPPEQPLVLAREPDRLPPQLLVLRRQRRTARQQPTKLIHRLGREHLNI